MKKILFRLGCLLVLLLLLTNSGFGKEQDNKPKPFAKIDKQKVDAVIRNGLSFLLDRIKSNRELMTGRLIPDSIYPDLRNCDELVLYTLIKGGADTNEEAFTNLLEKSISKKLDRTYRVALLAMALSELDKHKYQAKIAECGQFLIDNQCENGQWDYGKPGEPFTITLSPPSSDSSKEKGSEYIRTIPLKQRKKGAKSGDNSNTQYACLGLRACMQAGLIIPDSVFALTQKFLETDQQKDGGWDYGSKAQSIKKSYGSMTFGSLGSLVICKFYLTKKIPHNDPKIQKGIDWIIDNFTVKGNPKNWIPDITHYYYLYAIERLGALLETETFGKNEWYPAGAEVFLKEQESNGSWHNNLDDTCFAILFLCRATKPLRAIESK